MGLRALLAGGGTPWDGSPEEVVREALELAAQVHRAAAGLAVLAAGAAKRRSDDLPRSESLAARAGQRDAAALITNLFGVNVGQAKDWGELSAALQPRPGFSAGELPPLRATVAEAVLAGELGVEAALVIHRGLKELDASSDPALVAAAEAAMVANATGGRVNPFVPPPAGSGAGGAGGRPEPSGGRLGLVPSAGDREPEAGEPRGGQAPGPSDWGAMLSTEEGPAEGAHGSPTAGRSGGLPPAPAFTPILPPSMPPPAPKPFVASGSGAAGGRQNINQLREQVRGWKMVLNPDGAEPNYELQRPKRAFRLSPAAGGGFILSGFAPDVEGAAIKAVLDAHLSPRTKDFPAAGAHTSAASSAGAHSPDSTVHPEERPDYAQRTFDVLARVFELHAASKDAPRSGGAAPTLLITATIDSLSAYLRQQGLDPSAVGLGSAASPAIRPADLDTNGVPDPFRMASQRLARIAQTNAFVPLAALAGMLCNCAVQVLLQDQRGVPLRLGNAERLFSPQQRRTLMARDPHCRAPGCDAPAHWCEVHHVVPWSQGGNTDVTNGILVCNFHHHEIHRGRLRVDHHPDALFEDAYSVVPTWTSSPVTPRPRATYNLSPPGHPA